MVKRYYLFAVACFILAALVEFLGLNTSSFLTTNAATAHLPDNFWAHITVLGNGVTIVALAYFLQTKNPQILLVFLIAMVLGLLVIQPLKGLTSVSRPAGVLALEEFHQIGKILRSRSFPSGHTATGFIVATIIGLMRYSSPVTIISFVCAALIGLSRIALGVHWPVDVFAGTGIGIIIGCVAFTAFKQFIFRKTYRIRPIYQRLLLVLVSFWAAFWYQPNYPVCETFFVLLFSSVLIHFSFFYGRKHATKRQATLQTQ